MRRYWPLLVAVVLSLPAAGPAPAQQKEKIEESPYFPLKDGTAWVYQSDGRTITVRVTKHETVGPVLCARLEASAGDEHHVEHIAVLPDGIYKYRADGKDLEPPLCLLKLPPKAGQTWKAKGRTDGLTVTGTFVLGEADVAVPAGKYRTVTVTSADFAIAGRPMPWTYWFARGVGPVRQRVVLGGTEILLELKSFTAAK